MPALTPASPGEAGFDPVRLQRAYGLLQRWVESDRMPGATLCIGRRGRLVEPRFFGRHRPEPGAPALARDALFLVASITKPVTVTAVMMLVERGEIALHDKVGKFVPPFAANGKEDVTVLHLMTHTSGLPDMLPENNRLRREHKPFSAFIDAVCRLRLQFPPGTAVSYQSTGTAMLAELVQRVTGLRIAEFLRREVFEPLGMKDTSLGWQPEKRERIAVIRVPEEARATDWNWNSPYWLGFGAPWGGLITSPADLARLCQLMLNGGSLGRVRLLGPATVRAMTRNQLETLPEVSEVDRRCRPWGLGWRLNWPGEASSFGDLVNPRAYGHWGATGTLCWIDPEAEAFCILFTTQPLEAEGRALARVSNIVAAALV
jgi:CubicO group peptidase (beta-lactamase class C family)